MLQKIADAEEKLLVSQKQLDAQLRNARHLQILAPIQAKTRDQVLMAAGRMSAQLKWGRVEIWRLKCHRDILMMDLDEERNVVGYQKGLTGDAPSIDHSTVIRLNSKSSTLAPQRSPRSPPMTSSSRPTTAHHISNEEANHGMEDIFQTPPLTNPAVFHKAQASWELPPLNFDARGGRKTSISTVSQASPSLAPTPSRSSTKPTLSSEVQSPDPGVDAAEQALLQSGLVEVDKVSDSQRPGTGPDSDEAKDKIFEKDKLDRGKIRRSLHRTLREAHVPTHSRSKKGKDSSSTTATSETASEDVLSRGSGSFVVHGKKASVITFGTEFAAMTPEERMRLRKVVTKDESSSPSPATVNDDFHSVLAEPVDYHGRHGSAATASTTTRSFREQNRNLPVPWSSAPAIVMSDGDDSDIAVSFSDGRRTPLPPVEDEDEDDETDYLGVGTNQAMFYTPDASKTNSPTSPIFQETQEVSDEPEPSDSQSQDLKRENERLPTPPTPPQIAAVA